MNESEMKRTRKATAIESAEDAAARYERRRALGGAEFVL
jgi:hypothetical protein